jgi:hypothetical protein
MIEDHLAQAQGHLSIGEQVIARQRRVISHLERNGHDIGEANVYWPCSNPAGGGRHAASGARNSRLLNEQVFETRRRGAARACTH